MRIMKPIVLGVAASILIVGAVVAVSITPDNTTLICKADKDATWLGAHVSYDQPLIGGAITITSGPIWSAGAESWGDIVPPYSYSDSGKTVNFPGYNWTEYGKSIWNNGCLVLE